MRLTRLDDIRRQEDFSMLVFDLYQHSNAEKVGEDPGQNDNSCKYCLSLHRTPLLCAHVCHVVASLRRMNRLVLDRHRASYTAVRRALLLQPQPYALSISHSLTLTLSQR